LLCHVFLKKPPGGRSDTGGDNNKINLFFGFVFFEVSIKVIVVVIV